MALSISRKGTNKAGTILYIQDDTVWGGANPARNTVALYVTAILKKTTEEVIQAVNNTNALTHAEIQVTPLSDDGWFIVRAFALTLVQPSTIGGIYYNTTSQKVTEVTGVAPVTEKQLTDYELYQKTALNYAQTETLVDARSSKIRDNYLLASISTVRDESELQERSLKYSVMKMLWAGAHIQFGRGNKFEAQKVIEKLIVYGTNALNSY